MSSEADSETEANAGSMATVRPRRNLVQKKAARDSRDSQLRQIEVHGQGEEVDGVRQSQRNPTKVAPASSAFCTNSFRMKAWTSDISFNFCSSPD